MLTYSPPCGHTGSLVQALHEVEALLEVLRSEAFLSRVFVEQAAAVQGVLEWPCSLVTTVHIDWEDGRLCITAAEDGAPMSEREEV